ncbi:MAG TPA: AI-2E family transporter [Cyanobacteria bacterium UBA8543]|nr:AI-2E family transporter [Cyanobacteria bacterium UBA8543]
MPKQRLTVSLVNLLLVVTTGLLLVLLWQLRSLLLALMIALVVAATLAPIIDRAQKLRIPRWLAVIVVYLGLIGIVIGAGLLIGPTFVAQIERLIRRLPGYLEILRSLFENMAIRLGMTEPESLNQISQIFNTQALTAWGIRTSQLLLIRSYDVTRGILGGFFSVILGLLLSGYMLSGSQNLIQGLVNLFPKPWDERLAAQVDPVTQRMGGYIQGRVLVSGILGIVITLGLGFLGLSEFAVGLGVIAGFTNLIPFLGPVLGAVPALIVAIAQGGFTFLWVLLLFVIIQNVETYVLDPLLVGSSVKVHPLYQLLAVLGGTQVLGIIGALIAPPLVAGAAVLLENLYLKPKQLAQQQNESLTSLSTVETSNPLVVNR